MKILILASALSACAMNAAEPVASPGVCAADKASSLVGKPATADAVQKTRELSGAKSSRTIRPGMAVTMDYREDRVNILVDAANRIERVTCG